MKRLIVLVEDVGREEIQIQLLVLLLVKVVNMFHSVIQLLHHLVRKLLPLAHAISVGLSNEVSGSMSSPISSKVGSEDMSLRLKNSRNLWVVP